MLNIEQQQTSSLNKSGEDRSLRMSKIIDALVSDQTLPEESRGNFDTINKMYDKAVTTQEEITWGDYDPYRHAMMMLTGKLEKALSSYLPDRSVLAEFN
jgi:hypothetical protein